jgi:putative ABC transport system permease protein
VEAAALSSRLPFGTQRWTSDFTADGWPADRYGVGVRHDEVSPGLFRTLGVPLLGGRDFDPRDRLDAPGTVIVNRALAERYFPGESPVGRRIAFDRVASEGSTWRTVVGVVGNVRRESLTLD